MKIKNHIFLFIAFLSISMLPGCESNDPKKEDVPETITKVTLKFEGGGQQLVVTATDPDGEGIQSIKTDGVIAFQKSTTYKLTISLINGLADPNDAAYDVSNEVKSEGDEHMIFFGWSGAGFVLPQGNGNIDARADELSYADFDGNNLPLGLETNWQTGSVNVNNGKFRIILKHQPGLKTETSSSSDGETDLDVTFDYTVQ